MKIEEAYHIYNKVASLERVKRSLEGFCKMKTDNELSVTEEIYFSKDITLKNGASYPIKITLTIGDVICALRMLEEQLTLEVEKL